MQTGLAAVASLADYDDQPHPQARAHDAGQGRRPRPPDRGGQRPDRPGDDGLSRRAGDRRHARGAPPERSRTSMSPPTTACATSSGWSTTTRRIAALTRAFDALPAIYIADGHHRSAAAARVAQARGGARARTAISSSVIFPHHRDDDPRLQPRGARPERPQRRADCSPSCAKRFTVEPLGPAGAPGGVRRVRHVSRRPLVPADAPARARARERSDRPAADHAADAQRDRAAVRHHRSSAPTSASISSAAAAAWPSSSGGSPPARWRRPSRSIRRRWPT